MSTDGSIAVWTTDDPDEERREKKRQFLEELAKTNNQALACRNTGIPNRTIYSWRENDDKFNEDYELAKVLYLAALDEIANYKLFVEKDTKVLLFMLERLNKGKYGRESEDVGGIVIESKVPRPPKVEEIPEATPEQVIEAQSRILEERPA